MLRPPRSGGKAVPGRPRWRRDDGPARIDWVRTPSSAKRLLVCAGVVAVASGATGSPSGAVPLHGHVFVVVEENADYGSVVGTGAMPYLDTLIGRYGVATQYYAN